MYIYILYARNTGQNIHKKIPVVIICIVTHFLINNARVATDHALCSMGTKAVGCGPTYLALGLMSLLFDLCSMISQINQSNIVIVNNKIIISTKKKRYGQPNRLYEQSQR